MNWSFYPLPWWPAVAAAVLALLVAVLFFVGIFPASRREEFGLRRGVRRLGQKVLADVRIPDGLGGQMFIDYLVLTPAAIMLLSGPKWFAEAVISSKIRCTKWS